MLGIRLSKYRIPVDFAVDSIALAFSSVLTLLVGIALGVWIAWIFGSAFYWWWIKDLICAIQDDIKTFEIIT